MSRLQSSSGPDGDDAGPAKLYIGHVSSRANTRDLEDIFAKYGRVLNVEVKPAGYGFVEFGKADIVTYHHIYLILILNLAEDDPRDAQDAMHALNGYIFEGQRLVVEFSRRAGNANSNCFICGQVGHWVRECPENVDKGLDVRSGKCFKCGEVGHLAKFCRYGVLALEEVQGEVGRAHRLHATVPALQARRGGGLHPRAEATGTSVYLADYQTLPHLPVPGTTGLRLRHVDTTTRLRKGITVVIGMDVIAMVTVLGIVLPLPGISPVGAFIYDQDRAPRQLGFRTVRVYGTTKWDLKRDIADQGLNFF
ncbi:hypothetical protein SpCBS45565_g00881 [Spizellomyces sp. 'palustris']|nr:hypothetical protein SpCBS45565_g00881 [Spizellomyces sp. 'palustris']